jgi:response regulator RpfG family c-di-GMP phosphodiesterase
MDGLTLWGKIKEKDALKNIPFVLITAMNEIEMVKKAISEGVTDYVVKPITLQALTSKAAAALSRNQKA